MTLHQSVGLFEPPWPVVVDVFVVVVFVVLVFVVDVLVDVVVVVVVVFIVVVVSPPSSISHPTSHWASHPTENLKQFVLRYV